MPPSDDVNRLSAALRFLHGPGGGNAIGAHRQPRDTVVGYRWCRRFEVPAAGAANSKELQIEKRHQNTELPMPFVSEVRVRVCCGRITNFGNRALATQFIASGQT
jgi:hypothetical protein